MPLWMSTTVPRTTRSDVATMRGKDSNQYSLDAAPPGDGLAPSSGPHAASTRRTGATTPSHRFNVTSPDDPRYDQRSDEGCAGQPTPRLVPSEV
jgi:hypothetical protein